MEIILLNIAIVLFVLLVSCTIIFTVNYRRVKKESARRVAAAIEAAKNAKDAKKLFTSRMSHEIRTPLNAVIGYLTIASSARDDSEKVADCIEKADRASRHLLTIVNDVLDMSAIESGKFKIVNESFDLKQLISSVTSIFFTQARERGVNFSTTINEVSEERIIGDGLRVNQILMNLLSNAMKFTCAGGSVSLGVTQLEKDANKVTIRFTVSDTGVGMDEEFLGKIYTPYVRKNISASQNAGGTGLGLSIVKAVCTLMGGKIYVKSQKDVGTQFDVDIPFKLDESSGASQPYNFAGLKALLVDDENNTCEYVRAVLDRCGIACDIVPGGVEALLAINTKAGQNYDFCIVDWPLNDMNTAEFIEQIGSGNKRIEKIFICAYDFSQYFEEARKTNATAIIPKPLFQSSLFDLLVNTFSDMDDGVAKRANNSWDFSGRRILLAEDNDMNMDISYEILVNVGFTVDCVRNGREAAEMFLDSHANTYDAVIMDVQMPVMDGYDATKIIRISQHPQASTVPIIAMTADALPGDIEKARAAGMNDHIAKPIDLNDLFDKLSKYINY